MRWTSAGTFLLIMQVVLSPRQPIGNKPQGWGSVRAFSHSWRMREGDADPGPSVSCRHDNAASQYMLELDSGTGSSQEVLGPVLRGAEVRLLAWPSSRRPFPG